MGKDRLFEIKCFHRLTDPEVRWLKVSALNLFHPTASPLFRKPVLLYYDKFSRGERKGEGIKEGVCASGF
jgi:hypothetical protein